MKFIVPLLMAALLLGGCAAKKAVEEPVPDEVATAPAAEESPAPPVPVSEPVEQVVAEVEEPAVERGADRIFFDFDSYVITSDGKEILVDNALWLQAHPEVRIRIEGHTDERGSDTYNLALGEKRAQVARDYLLNLGIPPERVATISFGEEQADKGEATETVWAKNRRAEFVIAN